MIILTIGCFSFLMAMLCCEEGRKSILIPYLEVNEGGGKLMVDGRPWIMLAGELHNSTSSNLGYLEKVWDKWKAHERGRTYSYTACKTFFQESEGAQVRLI